MSLLDVCSRATQAWQNVGVEYANCMMQLSRHDLCPSMIAETMSPEEVKTFIAVDNSGGLPTPYVRLPQFLDVFTRRGPYGAFRMYDFADPFLDTSNIPIMFAILEWEVVWHMTRVGWDLAHEVTGEEGYSRSYVYVPIFILPRTRLELYVAQQAYARPTPAAIRLRAIELADKEGLGWSISRTT